MSERIVTANGLNIWTESFGNPNDTPLLLIAGASAQAIFWEEDFCQQLAGAGCFVIRYDQRDTGRSDSVDFASAPYTVSAMADDAVGILVLHQPDNYMFSCVVSVHGKARLAGKGLPPCQEVQRSPWALTKQPFGHSCDVPQPRCSACQGERPFPAHCALL